jgi:predicted transcriptional regulator
MQSGNPGVWLIDQPGGGRRAGKRAELKMKLSHVKEILECEVLSTPDGLGVEVQLCLSADMMSDVLAFAKPGALLVTGLTNSQSVRTAEIADATGIVYLRGKRPTEPVLELAREISLPVLATQLGMFEVCGRLFAEGMKGVC